MKFNKNSYSLEITSEGLVTGLSIKCTFQSYKSDVFMLFSEQVSVDPSEKNGTLRLMCKKIDLA